MTYDEEKKVADIIVALTELIGALESELAHEASHRQKLQNALAYWMPGVTEEIEISTNGRCGDDALLLVGSEGAFEDKCWGNEVLARAEAAEAEVKRLRDLLRFSHDTLWEINPSNYDHDDVCKLNDASVEVILTIAPELGETHGKSKEWWAERQALASTGGEHNADK